MRFLHDDRGAKLVDVFDDILWPLRRPAPVACSSVKFPGHDHVWQAFVPHAQYIPRERKSALFHGHLNALASNTLDGDSVRRAVICRAHPFVDAEASQQGATVVLLQRTVVRVEESVHVEQPYGRTSSTFALTIQILDSGHIFGQS